MAPAEDPAARHRELEADYTGRPKKGETLSIEALLGTLFRIILYSYLLEH